MSSKPNPETSSNPPPNSPQSKKRECENKKKAIFEQFPKGEMYSNRTKPSRLDLKKYQPHTPQVQEPPSLEREGGFSFKLKKNEKIDLEKLIKKSI